MFFGKQASRNCKILKLAFYFMLRSIFIFFISLILGENASAQFVVEAKGRSIFAGKNLEGAKNKNNAKFCCETKEGKNSKRFNNDISLKKLTKLYFLIHAFCYAELTAEQKPISSDSALQCYLERENRCARQWRLRLDHFKEDEALIIIPWHGRENGPANQFKTLADSLLGDRSFFLNCPDSFDASYWSICGDSLKEEVYDELKAAMKFQKDQWNIEELQTSLHALACCRQFNFLLKIRGYYFDKSKVYAESWGASFDGCVMKYSLAIRRMLDLSQIIEINFDMTVPDAQFLLDAQFKETILISQNLRLFLFKNADQFIALFTTTTHSMENGALFVSIPLQQSLPTVKSKQGFYLFPGSDPYHLPHAAPGNYEPPQDLVKVDQFNLIVPVSAGFVYRLAKAPAYVFAQPGQCYESFREMMKQAQVAQE